MTTATQTEHPSMEIVRVLGPDVPTTAAAVKPARERLLTLVQWGRRYRITGSAVGWWIKKGFVPDFTFAPARSSTKPWIPLSFIIEWENGPIAAEIQAIKKWKARAARRAETAKRPKAPPSPKNGPPRMAIVEKVAAGAGITRRQAEKALETLGIMSSVRLPKAIVRRIERELSSRAKAVVVSKRDGVWNVYATTEGR